jgi:hypothetical protein
MRITKFVSICLLATVFGLSVVAGIFLAEVLSIRAGAYYSRLTSNEPDKWRIRMLRIERYKYSCR